MRDVMPELVVNEHCETGENPLWDHEKQLVYWTDIPQGKIYCYSLYRQRHEIVYEDVSVGGFTMQGGGSLLLFRVEDVALLRQDGSLETLIRYRDDGMERFNDVITDPEGRVYAGTVGKTNESGGLYRFERDGSVRCVFRGTGCANGMGFSPDLKLFYWTCSTTRRIFQFRYDRRSGELSERALFYDARHDQGIPDGLAVDAAGNVWSARFDAGAIVKHSPEGAVLDRIEFPVMKITSLCFAWRDLDVLYVTSAGGKREASSEDGALFQVKIPGCGKPAFRSRILESQ